MHNKPLNEILAERGTNYGDYASQSDLSQKLKKAVYEHFNVVNPTGAAKVTPYMAESLELILHKIARIANGDPLHVDSWDDIAGYAKISADRIRAGVGIAPKKVEENPAPAPSPRPVAPILPEVAPAPAVASRTAPKVEAVSTSDRIANVLEAAESLLKDK